MTPAERIAAYEAATGWEDPLWLHKAKAVFAQQRGNARRRGIRFEFSFVQWLAWWEVNLGPTWLEERGAGKGRYCMARYGDSGPYSPENTKCVLHEENASEAAENDSVAYGERAGQAVLTEQIARSIYVSADTIAALSDMYGISTGTVIDIRSRRTWRRATEGLTRTCLRGRNQWQ